MNASSQKTRATMMRSQRGTSMVEVALLAPVFVFLLVGLVEIGRFSYFWIVAEHAARSGVQYGSQNLQTAADANSNGPGTTGAAKADANIAGWTVKSSLTCTVNGVSGPCPANNSNSVSPSLVYYVQVQVTGTVTSLLNYPGIPHSIPLSVTATQRVVNQ
jgi:Flp pilus assembly protein TadG